MKTQLIQDLEALVPRFAEALAEADASDVEAVRVQFLGRKGSLAALMAAMGGLDPQDRPEVGRVANAVKARLAELWQQCQERLAQKAQGAAMPFDAGDPAWVPHVGALHPTTRIQQEICAVLQRMGFETVSGPEVETDFHNFEALNLPPGHPARDMQDTLCIPGRVLLRTHTSPMQVSTMLARRPPLAIIAPGKVYRRDSDLTHTPMFHQIEGLLVDREVTMAQLRGVLTALVQAVFGASTRVRFRPSFFPFTEPSAEVDMSCVLCGGRGVLDSGEGCRVCKGTGWVEILGCGMVDPAVFAKVGIDPEQWSGFAFGLGVERMAMLKYGIGDLRLFFENDSRFVRQFA